jgi:PhzF family phenazine biosynthesis protein
VNRVIPFFVVDAFVTEKPGSGNPAAVCLLSEPVPDETLQRIATEINLSETAFVAGEGERLRLRWFTPTTEVDLCGHGTLAAGAVMFGEMNWSERDIEFETAKAGKLGVTRDGDLFELNFPTRLATPGEIPETVRRMFGARAIECLASRDAVVVLESERDVAEFAPNFEQIAALHPFALCVTARASDSGTDFVYRFFAPNAGIPEDPVTGSVCCTLAPYWSEKLGRETLNARQLSPRGGAIRTVLAADRVRISGRTRLFSRGEIV